jgi:polyisoprenyl-phosphate glycosyltransferase
MKRPTLAVIVPCYNEQHVVEESCGRLWKVLNRLLLSEKIASPSFIVFVDDGSTDDTWRIITRLSESFDYVRALKLSRNFGHQNAVLAGLSSVRDKSDISISIDADLQQDEAVMERFVDKYLEGYDIVFGVREDRSTDGLFKKLSALFFYDLMKVMGVKIVKNHADYRLISNRVLKSLSDYGEVNLFLRGLVASIGYRTTTVRHSVSPRLAGKSKYSIMKMASLALDGITSFSVVPIRLISMLGFLIFVATTCMGLYVLCVAALGKPVAGWASTVLPIYFFGGVQLLSVGLIGEYIGRIYKETKRRPRFIIEEEI